MKRIIDETLKGRIERTISNTQCALQKIADAVSDMGKEVTPETLMRYAGNPYWERDEKGRQIDEEYSRIARTLGSTLMTDSIRSLLASRRTTPLTTTGTSADAGLNLNSETSQRRTSSSPRFPRHARSEGSLHTRTLRSGRGTTPDRNFTLWGLFPTQKSTSGTR